MSVETGLDGLQSMTWYPESSLHPKQASVNVEPVQACSLAGMKKKGTWGSVTEMMLAFKEYGRQGGKLGGAKGGKARAKKLSRARRVAIAKKAAAASAAVRTKNAAAKRKHYRGRRAS